MKIVTLCFVCIRQDASFKLRVLKMSLWFMDTSKSRQMNQNTREMLIPVLSWKAVSCELTRKNLGDFTLSPKSICFLHECHFFSHSSLWPTAICRVYSDAVPDSAGTGHTFCVYHTPVKYQFVPPTKWSVSCCVLFYLVLSFSIVIYLPVDLEVSESHQLSASVIHKVHMLVMFATIQFLSKCIWCIYPFHLRMEAQTVIVIPLGSSGYLLLTIIVYSGALHTYYLFSRHL